MTGQRIMFDMRTQIYGHLQRIDVEFYDRNPVGRLMTRVTTDVDALNELFTSGVVSVFGDCSRSSRSWPMMIGSTGGSRWWRSRCLPLICAGDAVVSASTCATPIATSACGSRGSTRICRNTSRGWRPCSSSGRERATSRSSTRSTPVHREAKSRSIFYYAVFYPAIEIVSALATALLIWFGGGRVVQGPSASGRSSPSCSTHALLPSDQRHVGKIQHPARRDGLVRTNLPAAGYAGGNQVGSRESERREVGKNTDPAPSNPESRSPSPAGRIAFDHVWFAYDAARLRSPRRVIHRRSGRARRRSWGRRVPARQRSSACCCASTRCRKGGSRSMASISASGPRTAARPVRARAAGRAPVLGHDRRKHAARATTDQRRRSRARARAVHADGFIDRLPGGLDAPVAERGATLSVGQKQLLSFARALAFDPPVLVLDEATSSVDTETELLIRDALRW